MDQRTGGHVAIKKLKESFSSSSSGKRVYRELIFLKYLKHDNILSLKNAFISSQEDVYLVTELLSTDLRRLLKGTTGLDEPVVQFFLYQILCAVKYIHSAGIVHRDLKPGNILIESNFDLKICDFGLATPQETHMTGYISARHYRAPEVLLTWEQYDYAVDMWSVGCILAEMLKGKVLFPGVDYPDQIILITELLGSPSEETLHTMLNNNASAKTRDFLRTLPKRVPIPLQERLSIKAEGASGVLERMLVFDPEKRITAANALGLAHLSPYHDPSNEPLSECRYHRLATGSAMKGHIKDEVKVWRGLIYAEILNFQNRT